MVLLAGTSGYSYKEWLGHFYPEHFPTTEMLRYYAECFPTVEINNTFYRMPAESMLKQWAEQVPDQFTFTLKAPRRITHDKRLREAESNVTEFLRRAGALGKKLGVRAIMFCVTDTDEGDTPFVVTADCGYVRLRRTHYDDAELRAWVGRIAAKALLRTYVYFMHEDEALGTKFARRLNELWATREAA
jgi:uncharacterized protein YecE (DUF72 family)